jgi:extradiol dioxygenase family protein
MLAVSDFPRSVDFYGEKLGSVPGRSADQWAELISNGLSIFLIRRRPGQTRDGHGGAGITLVVSDIDDAKATLEARGISFIGDVIDAETLRLAIFEDPDENPIYLVQELTQ